MKRLTIVFLAACLSFMTATPTISAEVDFSGSYLVESLYVSKNNLNDNDDSNQWRQMRLRVQTEFKVSDNLKLTTRFDALEKLFGQYDDLVPEEDPLTHRALNSGNNIDFDRAYMTIITKVGLFKVGRMEGNDFGLDWNDYETDLDSIEYVIPLDVGGGKLYLAAKWEKPTENDWNDVTQSDNDNDQYFLAGVYKRDKTEGGLLFGFYQYRQAPDAGQRWAIPIVQEYGAAIAADGGTPGANVAALSNKYGAANLGNALSIYTNRGSLSSSQLYALVPYFKGEFGKFGVETELDYLFGTTEYDTGAPDVDAKGYSFYIQGNFSPGPLKFQAGYGMYSGDADFTDDEATGMGYVGPNEKWEKMFILDTGRSINGRNHNLNTSLANGIGNHVGGGPLTDNYALNDGFRMFYLGVDYAATEKATIGCIAAMSKADEVPVGVDDDQGVEVDLKLDYKIMDNLKFNGVAAYLAAGDYWKERNDPYKQIPAGDLADPYVFYGGLEMTF